MFIRKKWLGTESNRRFHFSIPETQQTGRLLGFFDEGVTSSHINDILECYKKGVIKILNWVSQRVVLVDEKQALMATVFRQQGSPYWYAAFFNGAGKRLHRSTKQTNKNEAVRVGAEMERLARRAVKPQKNESAGEIYRILEEAGVQALRGTLNEAKGRDMLNQILQISSGLHVEIPSIEEWLNGWLEEKKGSRTEGTYLRYQGVIKSFLKDLPAPKRQAPLTALSLQDIQKFRSELQKGGRAPTTVNMAVKILRTPMQLGRGAESSARPGCIDARVGITLAKMPEGPR